MKSCDTPPPPCAWIARSITNVATSAAATLIAEISTRAPRLPTVSISQAVLSTSSRACSILMRDSEIQRCTTPWSMIGRPKVERERRALAHHLERPLGHPDRAHRVVDAARARGAPGRSGSRRPPRRAGSPPARGRRRRRSRRGRRAARRRSRTARRAHDVDPRRVLRDEDHALAPVALGVRVGDPHDDQQLAARRHRTRRPPLAAVDDVLVAVALDPRRDVRRVGGGDLGLGHRERRADLALEQRLAASAPSARRCRTATAAPCCRCRAPSSSSPPGRSRRCGR